MKDKIIVITGASAGIGAAIAPKAGAEGARVVLAARRQKELSEVAAASGPDALAVVTDVTVRSDVESLARQALDRFGRVDVWINNAGRGITRAPSQITDDDLDMMMRDNVKSALYGMQAILPHFKERNAGQIINVSSMLGRIPFFAARAAYSASKHALNALTAGLRTELRHTHPGIVVTTVSPGVVATEFGLNALHGGVDSRSLPGAQSVDEVADVVLDVIRNPRIDVYTRPVYADNVRRYYEDMDAFERASFVGPK
ncbi:SDR family NAD(P)-dependent oxidoreductase [Polyangium jinanense]|uniref:SDR family oxidoreductase n=1 Tax=Polyangium jinanense TaxID=2829994 RepID=A0A9X3X2K3_9BACT|nr:SDR family oxidoreductase [Polyangium jinanense]MDC3955324.1 SDR family oxidoreductase [Polyangium jinanense]MDC3981625.1 SDR family oxidoreductase [Polyangium jinanense]